MFFFSSACYSIYAYWYFARCDLTYSDVFDGWDGRRGLVKLPDLGDELGEVRTFARMHRCRCVILQMEFVIGTTRKSYFCGLDGHQIKRCPECKEIIKLHDLTKLNDNWVIEPLERAA
jgi:hypothetical protein